MPHSATCLTCTCYCRLLAIFITPCRMSFVSSHSIALISPKCHDIPADAFQKFDMRQLVADVPLLPAGHGVLAGGAWQEIDGIAQRWEDSHRWTVEHSQRIIFTLVQSGSILSQQNVNLGKNKPRISETDLTKMFFVRLPPFCWPVRQSGASPDNREDPRGQVLWWHSSWCFRCERRECRVARGNWRRENRAKRYWSHRGQLGGDFGETGELNSCTDYFGHLHISLLARQSNRQRRRRQTGSELKLSKSEVSHTQHKETVRTCTSIISPTTQANVPNPSRSKSIYGITTQEIFGDNSWKMTMVGESIYLGSVPLNRLVFVPLDREL